MLTTQTGAVISTTFFSFLSVKVKVKKNTNGERRRRRYRSRSVPISMAAKKEEKSTPKSSLIKIVSQAAVGVVGLGFIDAGYSGDWSRIGVISKETEDVLKAVAFLVLPLCFFLIFSISKPDADD